MNGMTTGEPTGQLATRKEWIGLAVLMLPTLLIAMDFTVLHLAVPSITRELAPSSAQLLWIVDIYGFLIAGSLITMGTLGDRIGRRKLLMIGAAAFGVASALAAFATSPEQLIAARAVLGVAGATLMPSTMALLRNMFPDPKQFGIAIGIWVSGFSAGGAIGPLLGGWMLEYFSWGSVFLLNVPVMVLLLALGPVLLPEYRDPEPGRFDLMSAAQSLTAVLLAIFGVKRLAENGVSAVSVVSLVAGLVIGALFLRRQKTLEVPLVELRLFANRAFGASVGSMTIGIFGVMGVNFFLAQYLQLVLGFSPLQAGLWTLPGAIAFILTSNAAPRLVRWVRPVVVVSSGWVIAAVGFVVLTRLGSESGLLPLTTASVLMSMGFGMIVTLVVEMIMASAPPERAGAASALSETSQELGGALGLAVLGSLGTAIYRSAVTDRLPDGLTGSGRGHAQDTLGGAVATASSLQEPLASAVLAAAREAFLQSLDVIAVIGAAIFILISLLLYRVLGDEAQPVEPHAEDAAPAVPVVEATATI